MSDPLLDLIGVASPQVTPAPGAPTSAHALPGQGAQDPLLSMLGVTAPAQPAPAPPAAPAPATAPQSSSLLDGIGHAAYGAAKGAADMVQGPAQAVLHGANWLYDKMAEGSSTPKGPAGKMLSQLSQSFDKHLQEQETQYQNATPGSVSAGLGRFGAGVAPFLLSGGGTSASQVPGAVATASKLAQALRATGSAATQGAAFGLGQPVNDVQYDARGTNNYADSKVAQGAVGAAGGVASLPVGAALARLIRPNTSPDVASLIDQGISLTPGQILGGGYKSLEDKMTSIPLLGDMVKGAQQRTVGQFNTAAYNRALNPIGDNADGVVGRDGVQMVKDKLGAAYDDLLPKLTFTADPQFSSEYSKISGMASGLPSPQASQFEKVMQNVFVNKLGPQGSMDGIALKGVESDLSRLAKGYAGDASFDNRNLGSAIGETLSSIRSSLSRSNPQFADRLANINDGYANYARIRQAASSLGAKDGVFTPAQLQNAVKAGDKSAGKGNFATGNATMQDLSEAGKNIIGSNYPDSGTAGRGAILALPAIAGAAYASPLATALGAGAGALAAAPYTGVGQKIASALLAKRPALASPLAQALRSGAPTTGAVISPALAQFLAQQPQGGQ
jgi:hypothetical protein